MVVVGVDDSDHSYHALEWMVQHLAGAAELVIVHAQAVPVLCRQLRRCGSRGGGQVRGG